MAKDKKAIKLKILEIARDLPIGFSELTTERMINEIKSLLNEL